MNKMIKKYIAERRHIVKGLLPRSTRKYAAKIYRQYFSGVLSAQTDAKIAFNEKLKDSGLNESVIFYESFHGKSLNCSPRAIFEKLLASPEYAHLYHVWSIRPDTVIPTQYSNHSRVRFVMHETSNYGRALSQAKYLVNNSTFPHWFFRREGQVYANTWHGVPLKRMFRFESGALTGYRNTQRNFLQATHLLMPNVFAADALMESADVAPLVRDQTYTIGAPRIDETLNADRKALRDRLGVSDDQKVILYAPTWRGEMGKIETESPDQEVLIKALDGLDQEKNAVFIQMHNFTKPNETKQRTIPEDISTNAFLAAVDVLVSDFSSIMFDFMATGRPVLLYTYDRGSYESERGVNVPLETLPATICPTVQSVLMALEDPVFAKDHPQFSIAKQKFFPLDDGNTTTRAISEIFNSTNTVSEPRRSRVLIYGGAWRNNGISTSAINLLNALESEDIDIFILTQGANIDKVSEYAANVRRINENVRLLHRAGNFHKTKEESEIDSYFTENHTFENEKSEQILKGCYAREARRLLGNKEFDVVVDFSGYSRFWAALLSQIKSSKHVIYQHNDMFSEANIKYNLLYGVFHIYRWFDVVVSVSEETRLLNLANLSQYYRDGEHSSAVVRNMMNPLFVQKSAKAGIPDHIKLKTDRAVFSMAGRLSGEKAQARAIRALGILQDRGFSAQLVLMGDGALLGDLKREARRVGVEDDVVFAGHVSNPFSVIKKTDCFLLPSDYEGQPMVLLEALALGQPVVATDIAGSRSVLGDRYGLLVPPTDEGVAEGMHQFILGNVCAGGFDPDAYCEDALNDFRLLVFGKSNDKS